MEGHLYDFKHGWGPHIATHVLELRKDIERESGAMGCAYFGGAEYSPQLVACTMAGRGCTGDIPRIRLHHGMPWEEA